jgi:hypothetical protein
VSQNRLYRIEMKDEIINSKASRHCLCSFMFLFHCLNITKLRWAISYYKILSVYKPSREKEFFCCIVQRLSLCKISIYKILSSVQTKTRILSTYQNLQLPSLEQLTSINVYKNRQAFPYLHNFTTFNSFHF